MFNTNRKMKITLLLKGLLLLALGYLLTACQKEEEPLELPSSQGVLHYGRVYVETVDGNELGKMYFMLISPNTAIVTSAADFDSALVNRKYRGEVVIPETFSHLSQTYTVVGIKNNAFLECDELTLLDMPNTITLIENNAFEGCSSLEQVKLSNTVRLIRSGAFTRCSKLKEVELPTTVETLGDALFAGCSLETLTCRAIVPPNCWRIPFGYSNLPAEIQEIRVPQNSVNAYKSAVGWSVYADIIVGF